MTDIVGHVGTYTSDGAQIWRTGVPKEEQGKGVSWECSQHGAPVRIADSHGKIHTEQCKHLKHFFFATRDGNIPSGFVLTPDGERAAKTCGCLARAHAKGKGPKPKAPKAPPAGATPPPGLSRNGPCPCGSRKRLKRCEGTPDAPHAYGVPPRDVLPPLPPGAPPWAPPLPPLAPKPTPPKPERKERARIARLADKAEATRRFQRVEAALKHAHEWDEKRREKRRAADEKRRAAKKSGVSS
jgi:hypothetical protein